MDLRQRAWNIHFFGSSLCSVLLRFRSPIKHDTCIWDFPSRNDHRASTDWIGWIVWSISFTFMNRNNKRISRRWPLPDVLRPYLWWKPSRRGRGTGAEVGPVPPAPSALTARLCGSPRGTCTPNLRVVIRLPQHLIWMVHPLWRDRPQGGSGITD